MSVKHCVVPGVDTAAAAENAEGVALKRSQTWKTAYDHPLGYTHPEKHCRNWSAYAVRPFFALSFLPL